MRKTIEQYAQETRDALPAPGTTPVEHLRHTVAAFTDVSDDDMPILATGGVYAQNTGITWGDLRVILDWLDRCEEHLAPDHPAFQ